MRIPKHKLTSKKDREEIYREKYDIHILHGDIVRIQIGTALYPNSEYIGTLYSRGIMFYDSEGRFWSSTERYTLVLTKERNSDDE